MALEGVIQQIGAGGGTREGEDQDQRLEGRESVSLSRERMWNQGLVVASKTRRRSVPLLDHLSVPLRLLTWGLMRAAAFDRRQPPVRMGVKKSGESVSGREEGQMRLQISARVGVVLPGRTASARSDG